MQASLATLGTAVTAVLAYDAAVVARLRRDGRRPAPLQHDGTVGEGEGAPLRLAVLGDSAAAGHGLGDPDDAYPRQLARALARRTGRPVALVSRAVDGARTADLARHQAAAIAGTAPHVVVCSVGVNDALAARRPRDVERDTRDLIRAVRAAAPDAALVVVGCPDLGHAPGLPWPLRQVVGWSCRRVARAQAAAVRRTGAAFARLPAVIGPRMFGHDGVHPGPEGQRAVAELTARTIPEEKAWISD